MRYVKPHGALYNAIVSHEEQAAAVVAAVVAYDATLPVLGLPGSAWLRLAGEAGLTTVHEAFADRAYTPQGTLVSRRLPGAVLHDPAVIAQRCVAMATGGGVLDVDGGDLALTTASICVHGDTAGAVDIARQVRAALADAGTILAPFAAVMRVLPCGRTGLLVELPSLDAVLDLYAEVADAPARGRPGRRPGRADGAVPVRPVGHRPRPRGAGAARGRPARPSRTGRGARCSRCRSSTTGPTWRRSAR